MKKELENCKDCSVKPGEIHEDGCDVEMCSVCGEQRLGDDCEGHDKAFARWTGIWPGFAEAEYLGIDLNALHIKYGDIFFKKKVINEPEFLVNLSGEPLKSKTPKLIGAEIIENLKDIDVKEDVTISIKRTK